MRTGGQKMPTEKKRSQLRPHRLRYARRGAVAVQVAVLMTVLLGFAALTIDVGAMYNARGDMQRAADSAALAAAALLSDYSQGDPLETARAAAVDLVGNNDVFGGAVTLDPEADVIFGRANYNYATNAYSFEPTVTAPDSVRVRVRRTADSPSGSMPMYFANVFHISSVNIAADAIAMNIPRDIAVVADLSASHTDDSELKHYALTQINLHEVWDAFPGGIDDAGGSWDPDNLPAGWTLDEDGYTPQAAGPAWGLMKQLGYGTTDENVVSGYSPSADAGLIRLQYSSNWSNATLNSYLIAQGYNTAERNAINNGSTDGSGYYDNRVAVALGLARWNSGIAGGLWQSLGAPPGNANTTIGDSELTWLEAVPAMTTSASAAIWRDWIDNYVRSTNNEMYSANSGFRYRFGVKTFINYLMEKRPTNSQTPLLAGTPEQPMKAVKDGVNVLAAYLDDLDTDDQVSLEVYGTTGVHEVDLSLDPYAVSNRLNEMQAGHYNTWTNIGGGIQRAIEELASARARPNARKMIFLLTDGYANVNSSGGTGDYAGGNAYAVNRAEAAAAAGIRIYTISVGAYANPDLMEQIAQIGNGEHFFASSADIDGYTAQLQDIFATLGGRRPVMLIK